MDAELNRLRSEMLELEHALGAAERMNLARKTKWEEEETKLRRQVGRQVCGSSQLVEPSFGGICVMIRGDSAPDGH